MGVQQHTDKKELQCASWHQPISLRDWILLWSMEKIDAIKYEVILPEKTWNASREK